ncbi:hypothetical protein AB0F07_27960 [Streptomyces fructofermentans]|uniref:hypothetical protein n=1 Tax=Streptomyces fructofermentans TaxID=152141 RepID=UPI0033EFBD6C
MSSTGTGLTAGWAVWGKRPSRQGYHVISACPAEWHSAYNEAIQHWSPGTPAPTDTLPWITIGPRLMPDGQLALGVYVLHGTDSTDVHNRPINRITHVWVPYEEAAVRGLGWTSLARAALGVALGAGALVPEQRHPKAEQPGLTASGGAVELAIGDDEHLVHEVDEVFTSTDGSTLSTNVLRWHAAVAARLLDGPVVVTGGTEEDALERLRLLDNIAAMLPYALRAEVSAATATSSGANHRIQLSWGRPAVDVECVPWQAVPPAVDVLSPAAREYHDLLIHAWESRGGPTVLNHLADAIGFDARDDAARLTPARQAYELLSALDDRLAVEARALRGQPVAPEVLDGFLRDPQTHRSTAKVMSRAKLSGPSTDISSLSTHLDDPQIAALVRQRLAEDLRAGDLSSVQERVGSLLGATARDGSQRDVVDRAVAHLVTLPDASGEGVDITSVLQLLPSLQPFAPDTMPFTRGTLASRPELAHGLLRGAARGAQPVATVVAWLDWLGTGPEGGAELPLLRDLLLGPSASVWPPPQRWAAKNPEAAARLLDLAVACGRGEPVLGQEFFGDLCEVLSPLGTGRVLRRGAASSWEAESAPLRDVLANGPYAVLTPQSQARWDLLCALADEPLTAAAGHHGDDPSHALLDTYSTSLCRELKGLRQRDRAVAGENLLRELLCVAKDRRPGATARAVTERLVQAPTDPALCRLTGEAVAALLERRDWRADEEDARWLTRLATSLPSLKNVTHLYALRDAVGNSELTTDELAGRLRTARRAGVGTPDLCEPVTAWAKRHRSPGTALLNLLEAFLRAHRDREDPTGPAERLALERELSRGRVSELLWPLYYTAVTNDLRDQETEAVKAIRKETLRRDTIQQRLQHLNDMHVNRY